VCGGLNGAGTTTDVIWRIDPAIGRATTLGHLAAAVHDAGGAALGSTGLVLGGGRSGPGTVVQSVGAAGTSALTGRLPVARADLVAVSVGGQVLVVGGGTPARYDLSVLATADGRHFRKVASLQQGVRYPAVAALDGRIYVVGGSTPSGDTRDIQVVDPASGSVIVAGRLPFGLSHASAFVVGGELLVAGGRRAGLAQSAVWRLQIGANGLVSAIPIGRLPYPVSDAAAVVLNRTGYLLGGEGARVGVPLDTVISLAWR